MKKVEMKLKYYRSLLGLTQKKMADELNIGITSYLEKEKGRIGFSSTETALLLELFKTVDEDVSFEAIFMP